MDLDELLAAVGGAENVRKVDMALARIRVGVVDKDLVDKPRLERMGAIGVVVQRRAVQLIFGPEAEQIGMDLARRLFGEPEE
ncbi:MULTISPECIES: glucose PTS transporter subunit EIIB [Trueperella]|uniref:Glucose PTS transporter subunit EIIB n=1 Tax=Trueperella bernardiae TaxID=59561 RepID=A0A0W1KIG0_9ACTO|nr:MULTISPECIES: glucose PTS transporter subunit EIIB [Trueperella]KTF03455.1 PTS system glucoside-specific EIICBA component [Trueperella bernardiae]MCM3908182.1 glucose PTS transporter subunit EIIB [Trueperella bernardiae]MDK8602712.1 glucose PTS transporter subunit EIIB [Trueperella bernardiae]MDV6239203.1 glucose PTS transporter subunit EIIB [Trueperella bernardiae]OCW59898.1 hypothetical protein AKG36_07885 [Trueperella bernardiae]